MHAEAGVSLAGKPATQHAPVHNRHHKMGGNPSRAGFQRKHACRAMDSAAVSEPKRPTITIPESADQCLKSFQQCLFRASSVHPRELSMVEDQLARFSTWAAAIGVFATGRASINHHLRYAPEVQSVVTGLLESLDYRIRNCKPQLIPTPKKLHACTCPSDNATQVRMSSAALSSPSRQ